MWDSSQKVKTKTDVTIITKDRTKSWKSTKSVELKSFIISYMPLKMAKQPSKYEYNLWEGNAPQKRTGPFFSNDP